jgi:hypothetical protein
MKLNLKDLNVKQIFIGMGEKIALGVAVLLMLAMLVTGVILQYFGGANESSNTEAIENLTKAGEAAFQNSMPTPDVGRIPPDLLRGVSLESLDPNRFPTPNPFFTLSSLDDNKWRLPEVLAPDEFQVDLMRGLVRSYVLSQAGDKIAVLVPKEKPKGENPPNPNQPQPPNKLLNPGMRPGQPGPGQPGPGQPGAFRPTLPDRPILPGAEGQERSKIEHEIRYIQIQDLGTNKDTVKGKPAEALRPTRFAVIQAAFPYQAQLDEFRRALRAPSIAALMEDKEAIVEFLGIQVQRREILPDGKVKDAARDDGWKNFDAKKNFLNIWNEAISTLPEDAEMLRLGLVWPKDRLVFPRLKLARNLEYPLCKLQGIDETIAAMKKQLEGGSLRTIAPPKTKLKDEDVLFETEPAEPRDGRGRPPAGGGPPPVDPDFNDNRGNPTRSDRRVIPEKCLIRFYDFSVQPGATYQYRVQVLMANPLFGKEDLAVAKNLTEKKEIVGKWSQPTPNIVIPRDLHFYVVDEKPEAPKQPGSPPPPVARNPTPNQVVMQAHRWLDWILLNPAQKASETAVGDWTICQRFLATRGEYVGTALETDIPVWWPTLEEFVMAVRSEDLPRKDPRSGKWVVPPRRAIPVDFSDHEGRYPLLVDFRGGRVSESVKKPDGRTEKLEDSSAQEVLLLMPDGRLIVRNNRADADNEERKDRVEAWKAWMTAVRDRVATLESGSKPSGGGLFEKPNEK